MAEAEADDQGGAGWPTQQLLLQNIQRRAVSGGHVVLIEGHLW